MEDVYVYDQEQYNDIRRYLNEISSIAGRIYKYYHNMTKSVFTRWYRHPRTNTKCIVDDDLNQVQKEYNNLFGKYHYLKEKYVNEEIQEVPDFIKNAHSMKEGGLFLSDGIGSFLLLHGFTRLMQSKLERDNKIQRGLGLKEELAVTQGSIKILLDKPKIDSIQFHLIMETIAKFIYTSLSAIVRKYNKYIGSNFLDCVKIDKNNSFIIAEGGNIRRFGVKKETKPVVKKVKKETKPAVKKVKKETKPVVKNVKKETKPVKNIPVVKKYRKGLGLTLTKPVKM